MGRSSEGRINGMGQRELLGRKCRCRFRSQGSRARCREQSRVHRVVLVTVDATREHCSIESRRQAGHGVR